MREIDSSLTIDEMIKKVWATLDEMNEMLRKSALESEKRRAEYEQRQIEIEKKEKLAEKKEKLAEKKQKLAEKKQIKAEKIRQAEAEKRQAEFDRINAETAKRHEEFVKYMEKSDEKYGQFTNNLGYITEEYFYNSFDGGKTNFFGEDFDDILKNLKGIKKDFKDEYDILLINGKTIGIIEVKYKANTNDIPKVLRKAETFRINFPEYKNHKVFLGLATLAFYQELEDSCNLHGIAIIKNKGDKLIINDEHIKPF
ncbi:MAG: hypothetical protein FWG98_11940 [Candidatus Cloacimonetes bacterium]|nr:hypothetical protein [Candidatus Cloacimonadota bacterium]